MLTGGCHCGAIRYSMPEDVIHHSFCHCGDCRRHAGAPVVSWAGVKQGRVEIEGTPLEYRSSENTIRFFCGTCGTGLFYVNDVVLPGLIDVQTATLDEPERLAPQLHVQVAERLSWMKTADDLPEFERYPG
jgi:hypothetical protein